MDVSCVITSAIPDAAYIIPAVMMKNGTFSFAMKNPFINPQAVPIRIAMMDAGRVPMPPLIRSAATQPTSAAIDGTDQIDLTN